jgi:hypothetical protein
MRHVLGFLLFDIIFHSLAAVTTYQDWLEEVGLQRFPRRLPTQAEIVTLAATDHKEGETPVTDRFLETLDSVWDYFKPWPETAVRRKLTGWDHYGMFALSWLASRLDFFESLAGAPKRWTMFSPNASTTATVARMRLLFQDGSRQDVRLTADPADLTSYAHWFEEKILDYELKVAGDYDSRLGYCNYLSHQHPKNGAGSPLDKIYIYKVRYSYPAPEDDARAVLKAQNGPPDWDRDGPSFVYEVPPASSSPHGRGVKGLGTLRSLSKAEREAAQKQLTAK